MLLGKNLIHIALTAAFILSPTIGFAQDLSIFDSRRAIPMADSETTYRDFYINGGIEHGVKQNMILTVKRRLTLYDSYRANTPIEIMVDVGRVKIIHTQKGLSVARLYSKFKRKNKTILENDFIMVGDKIDMSTALMETQLKKKSARKTMDKEPEVYGPQLPPQEKRFSSADFSSISPSKNSPPVEMSTLQ